jgi:hypothetical protein
MRYLPAYRVGPGRGIVKVKECSNSESHEPVS